MNNSEQPAHHFKSNKPWDHHSDTGFSGLTKREYFAGLAMQAYFGGEFTGQSGMPCEDIAERSVQMADALLKELEK